MSSSPTIQVQSLLRQPAAIAVAGPRPSTARRLSSISKAVRWMVKETPLLEISLTCAVFVGVGSLMASQPEAWSRPVLSGSASTQPAPLQKWVDTLAERLGLPPRPADQQNALVPPETAVRSPRMR